MYRTDFEVFVVNTSKAAAEENVEEYKESHLRSLLKATSWRILATITTTVIAFFIIGEIETALTIGGIEFILKFLIYYAHERAWQRIPRGGIRRFVNRFR